MPRTIKPGYPPTVLILSLALSILLGSACQTTSNVTFQAKTDDGSVRAVLMNFDSQNADPATANQDLGNLPVTIDYNQLSGKILRLSKQEGESQFWIFPELAGSSNQAIVSFNQPTATQIAANKDPAGNQQVNSDSTPQRRNLITRILLRSYQALSGKKFALAVQLAEQAQALDPVLAGPYLIKGLAQMQMGNRDAAKVSLTQARTLDPDDRDLDTLLKAVQ